MKREIFMGSPLTVNYNFSFSAQKVKT